MFELAIQNKNPLGLLGEPQNSRSSGSRSLVFANLGEDSIRFAIFKAIMRKSRLNLSQAIPLPQISEKQRPGHDFAHIHKCSTEELLVKLGLCDRDRGLAIVAAH